jgi:hypothetical protein
MGTSHDAILPTVTLDLLFSSKCQNLMTVVLQEVSTVTGEPGEQ